MSVPPKPFGIFFHHGGQFIPDGKVERYVGGALAAVCGDFDPDRFEYFDLVDELNKLGFQRWKRLTFQKPWSVDQVDIKGDAQVMEMISRLREVRTQICNVYVVDGQKGEQEHIVQKKSVGSSVLESMGGGGMKQKVIQSVKKSKVETMVKSNIHSITKRKRETTVKNGINKAVEDNLEKTVDKNVEKRVQKSLFQSTQEVVVESSSASGRQNERGSRSASWSMNERGSRSATLGLAKMIPLNCQLNHRQKWGEDLARHHCNQWNQLAPLLFQGEAEVEVEEEVEVVDEVTMGELELFLHKKVTPAFEKLTTVVHWD